MGLETGTYISDLVASNPVGAADPKSQGDDHLRLIKSTILATFPSITGAVSLTHTQINNAAIKTESNIFTGTALTLQNGTPQLRWDETDATADNGIWIALAAGELFTMRAYNDALTNSSAFFDVNRTGLTIDDVSIRVASNELAIKAEANGAVRLYYDANQRLVTGSTGLLMNGSVASSAPPVSTDAPNTRIQMYDSGANLLGDIGFLGGSALQLTSRVHGGNVTLRAENDAGSTTTLFDADPEGAARLYYDGNQRFFTNVNGSAGLVRDDTNDATALNLQFYHSDLTLRGVVGYNGSGRLEVQNRVHGENVRLSSEDLAGTTRTLLEGDPDGSVTLYEQGGVRFQTISDGINVRGISGNDPTTGGTQDTRINFQNSGALQIGLLEWPSSAEMRLHNLVHGGNVGLMGQQAAGGNAYLLLGDPDGSASLYFAGSQKLDTRAEGLGLRGQDNTDAQSNALRLEHLNGTLRATLGFTGDGVMRLSNRIHGENIELTAEDAGGTSRTILAGDPDGNTTLYDDGLASLRTQNYSLADKGTGAEVLDGGGTFRPVGFNVLPLDGTFGSGNVTLALTNVGYNFEYNTGTARTLFINSDANIPVGAAWSCTVGPSGGTLTADGGTGVTIRYWNGSSYTTTSAAGNITLGEGRHFIYKIADTQFQIDGPNIS